MNDKQMIPINEDSFFYRIKKMFSNIVNKIFNKSNKINKYEQYDTTEECIKEDINSADDSEISISNNILLTPDKITEEIPTKDVVEKVVVNENINNKDMVEFLNKLDGNIEMLKLLSIERLKKLEDYYDEIIRNNNDTINNMI